jgi:hypothetical protein
MLPVKLETRRAIGKDAGETVKVLLKTRIATALKTAKPR